MPTTVLDLITVTAPRLKQIPQPAMSAIEAVNAGMDVLFRYLVSKGSDLVKADYSLEFAAGGAATERLYAINDSGEQAPVYDSNGEPIYLKRESCDASKNLPTDCRGLADKPQLTTMTEPLEPLQTQGRSAYYGQTGTPERYDIRGLNLLLYPVPDEACTVIGEYWQAPARVTAITDALPYDGMFDEVFKESIVRGAAAGSAFAVDQAFMVFLSGEVDSILPKRKAGRRRTSGCWF